MNLLRFVFSMLLIFTVYVGNAQVSSVKVHNLTPFTLTVGAQFTVSGPPCSDMCTTPPTIDIPAGATDGFSVSDCNLLRVGAFEPTIGDGYIYHPFSAGCGFPDLDTFTFVWITPNDVEIHY